MTWNLAYGERSEKRLLEKSSPSSPAKQDSVHSAMSARMDALEMAIS